MADKYPKQMEDSVGRRVLVVFTKDESDPVPGTVLRNDAEEPYLTIIQLDDGRVVTDTGCGWKYMSEPETRRYRKPDRIEPMQ